MTHDLKCHPAPFRALLMEVKHYEIRRADRPFAVGDTVRLMEYVPATTLDAPGSGFTGREVRRRITYISAPGTWGLPSDVCVLALEPPDTLRLALLAQEGAVRVRGMVSLFRAALNGIRAALDLALDDKQPRLGYSAYQRSEAERMASDAARERARDLKETE